MNLQKDMSGDEQYSKKLCAYLGKVEIEAFYFDKPYSTCFRRALENLPRAGLSEKESKLARKILENRIREQKPWGG